MSENAKQSLNNVTLGINTRLADFINLYGCEVGDNSRIGAFVEIQKNAVIGKNVKVSSHTFICEGVTIEDNVFVGHNVSFINDKYPRATANGKPQTEADWVCVPTLVKQGASIGTSSTILCGVTIGENAIVGSGSVVTRDVPANSVVTGVPARFVRTIESEDAKKEELPAPVPFPDLKADCQLPKSEIQPAVNEVPESCALALGEDVTVLEKEFVAFRNSTAAIAVTKRSETAGRVEPAPVPFLDLKAQYQSIKAEIQPAINNVLESCAFVLGGEVAAFEKEFAAYHDAVAGIAVNTGTSALHLALLAAGIGPGDEVITVPFTFVATAAAIGYTGARPVFVDIDPQTLTMDVASIEAAITPSTKAILPVHLYGQPADMDPICEIARRHKLIVIEDACQAHGARYKGRRVGSIGDLGCFSFYPGKNLGAYGEGGMVLTNNEKYEQIVRMLRDWGAEGKYNHILKGYNYRMEGMQGAILRVKLRHLEAWTDSRRTHAARYNDLLADSGVGIPQVLQGNRHVYHIYAIRVPQREKFQSVLTAHGIHTGIHYPIPVHMQPAYTDLGYKKGDFPNAEAAASETLSLPLFAELTPEQQDLVVEGVHKAVRSLHNIISIADRREEQLPECASLAV